MSEFHGRRVSRRELLRSTAVGAVALVLGACQPKVVEVEKIVTKEVEKEVEKVVKETVEVQVAAAPGGPTEVNIIAAGWVDAAWQISQRTNAYNASQEAVRVNIIPVPEGWETKAMSQIEQGAPAWDGYVTHHPFRMSVQWLAQGLIQVVDDYLETSPVLDMAAFWADTIDQEKIQYDCSVKGQTVGVPLGIDTTCFAFNAELMEEAGLPHTREDVMREYTWEAVQLWAETIRERFKGEGVWGITTWPVYHQSLGAIFQSITSDLYDDQGLIKFDSDAMIRAMEIQSRWSWTEVAPTPAWDTGDKGAFAQGKVGMRQGQVGTVGAAQRVWGQQTIPFACPVLVEEGGTGGNQWYTTCGFVLNKAAHPQEVVDFYLHLFGPHNDQHAELTLGFNWFPIFRSQWDKQVGPHPDLHWAKDFLPQFQNAKLVPRNPYYEIEQSAAQLYCELSQAKKMTPAEACAELMKEVKQKVSELKIEW